MPFGVVAPWNEVKRRAIVDALDQCGGAVFSQRN
jgi:hypothetical protein